MASDLQTLMDRARSYERQKNYVEAERTYKQALALAPNDAETLKRLGILYQTELKFKDSIDLLQRLLTITPQYPEANFILGLSYFNVKNFPAAIESLQRELGTSQPHPRCRYYLALALDSVARAEEATAQLDRLVAENPKGADADELYLLALRHRDASQRAIQMLKTLDPDAFQLHALLGQIYAEDERYEDAVREYRAALAKRPDAPGLHYNIAVGLWALAQTEAAEKEFLEARKEDPNNPLTNLYLGEIAVNQHRFLEAIPHLKISEAADSRFAWTHLLLGRCYQGLEDFERAKIEFITAADADPNDAQSHYLLSQVYRKTGDREASARELAMSEKLTRAEKEKKAERSQQAIEGDPKSSH
jgi:tetratricopeptide (TPR) repeat protein